MNAPQKKYQDSAKGRATKRVYYLAHKDEINARKAEWRKKFPSKEPGYYAKMKELFPEKIEKKNFQSRILLSGIEMTFEEYLLLKKKHKGRCAICNRPNRSNRALAIDHNHKTGRVRGLLCGKCNIGIGLLGDDVKSLRKAVKYLESHI